MARDTLASGTSRKYILHPVADSASSFVQDGHPLDAGTWHILVNNAHVLLQESARHLFTDAIGTVAKATDRGWDSLDEDEPPSAQRSTTGSFDFIAWNMLGATPTARRYGPFPVVGDRAETTTASTEYLPRRIGISARYNSDGTNAFKLYLAVTAGPEPPTDGVLAYNVADFTTTSAADVDTSKIFSNFYEPRGNMRHCSVPTARGAGFVHVPEVYIWVGWDADAVTGTAAITSVSAWEMST